MTINPSALGWIEVQHGGVAQMRPASGGCIHAGKHVVCVDGTALFVKQAGPGTPGDVFSCEAQGLEAIHQTHTIRVPEVVWVGQGNLILEDLQPAPRRADYWQTFGEQFAALHMHTADRYGFDGDNYIGSTPQVNAWMADGYAFYIEQRLLAIANRCLQSGAIPGRLFDGVSRLCNRLKEIIPEQPASLLHGDLWAGNALSDSAGGPAIIDPAAYYGWAEADLAMTALFGGFPERFYAAYQAARPLAPGVEQRYPVYNLYHILNHALLFGGGYASQAAGIVGYFVGR